MRLSRVRRLYYPNDTFFDPRHRPVQYQWLPRRLLLVRHGESEANVDREIYSKKPDWQIELTERGRDQAFDCGRRLRRLIGDEQVYMYYSPYMRTRQTLEEMRKSLSDEQIQGEREDERLREQEMGNYQPMTDMDATWAARHEFSRLYYRFPFGESSADVGDRVSGFFDSLLRERIGLTVPNMNESMLRDSTEDILWHSLGWWRGRERAGPHETKSNNNSNNNNSSSRNEDGGSSSCGGCDVNGRNGGGLTLCGHKNNNNTSSSSNGSRPLSNLGTAADRGVLPPNALGAAAGDDQNVVIVAHGLLIRLFIGRWFRVPMEVFETMMNPPNCAIVVLERNDEIGRLVMTDHSRALFGSDPLLQMMRFDGREDAQWYRERFLGIVDPPRMPEDDDENHYSRSRVPKDYQPPARLVDSPPVKRPASVPKEKKKMEEAVRAAAAATAAAGAAGVGVEGGGAGAAALSKLAQARMLLSGVIPSAAAPPTSPFDDMQCDASGKPVVTPEEASRLRQWLKKGFW